MNDTRTNDMTTKTGHPALAALEHLLDTTPSAERKSTTDQLVRLLGTYLAEPAAPAADAPLVDPEDVRYSRMPQAEFEREKAAAKEDRRFGSWTAWRNWVERVDALRRAPAPPVAAAPPPPATPAARPATPAGETLVAVLAEVPTDDMAETLAAAVRLVMRHQLAAPAAYEDRLAWGTLQQLEQEEAELRVVRMTPAEFEREKQLAKRDRRFASWDEWRAWVERMDRLRRPAPAARRPTPLEAALALRREFLENPHTHFECQAELDREIASLNAEIRRLGGTVPRDVVVRTDDQRQAVTCIEARLRQARALAACRRLLAARTIQSAASALLRRIRNRSECPICGDPAPADAVYCSRSCLRSAARYAK